MINVPDQEVKVSHSVDIDLLESFKDQEPSPSSSNERISSPSISKVSSSVSREKSQSTSNGKLQSSSNEKASIDELTDLFTRPVMEEQSVKRFLFFSFYNFFFKKKKKI